jgi:hypothetical protein
MTDMGPGAYALALAALAIVTLVIKGVVMPAMKKRQEPTSTGNPHLTPEGKLWCQDGKFGERLATLEEHDASGDQRLERLETKLDTVCTTSGEIKLEVARVAGILEWMKDNGKKRESDR